MKALDSDWNLEVEFPSRVVMRVHVARGIILARTAPSLDTEIARQQIDVVLSILPPKWHT